MNFEEYQIKCLRTENWEQDAKERLINYSLGLGGESGELLNVIKKAVFHGHGVDNEFRNKAKEEIGDCLWYLSSLASTLGMSLEDIAKQNIAKLVSRYPYGFSEKDSKERKT